MEVPGIDVELGDHEYRMVPQRQGRLTRKLFGAGGVLDLEQLGDLTSASADFAGFRDLIGGRIYELLRVFLPEIMPRWEFDGYASAEAAERDEYDDERDASPTPPQINHALETAVTVNGLSWVKKLTGFFDSTLLRAEINATVARFLSEQRAKIGTTPASPSLQQPSGASDPTSSGTTEATPPPPSPPVEA